MSPMCISLCHHLSTTMMEAEFQTTGGISISMHRAHSSRVRRPAWKTRSLILEPSIPIPRYIGRRLNSTNRSEPTYERSCHPQRTETSYLVHTFVNCSLVVSDQKKTSSYMNQGSYFFPYLDPVCTLAPGPREAYPNAIYCYSKDIMRPARLQFSCQGRLSSIKTRIQLCEQETEDSVPADGILDLWLQIKSEDKDHTFFL
ncbi:hypothetical protein CBL_10397 [Carabus blaptoides fortunei]